MPPVVMMLPARRKNGIATNVVVPTVPTIFT